MTTGMCRLFFACLLLAGCSPAPAPPKPAPPSLEEQAKRVLADPDNVARGRNIGPVFALAEQYTKSGETNQALRYYTAGLEHAPWNLNAQMAFAELLVATGKPDVAREKAQLVWDHAEADTLLSRAAALTGRDFQTNLPHDEPWPANGHCVALVPIGTVDAWLVRDLGSELSNRLHIPVIMRQVQIPVTPADRSPLDLRLADLRQRLAASRTDPQIRAIMRRQHLSFESLKDDQTLLAFVEAVLNETGSKEQARQFRDEIEFLQRLGPQWEAVELLTALRNAVGTNSPRHIHLGLTMLDLYSGESRYVFGIAGNGSNCAVMSYRRYTSTVTLEPPNRGRLKDRTAKQALSSIGLALGLRRCTDPTCARAYVDSLAQHDAKQLQLCAQCDQNFANAFRTR